jgi:hypothetical protein
MMEPAQTVINKCGGFAAAAEMAERSEVRVRRWTYSKDKGGTGGLIPAESQVRLLAAAKARGLDLRPEHFFLPDCPPSPTPSEDAA